jgi:hypothetical protein
VAALFEDEPQTGAGALLRLIYRVVEVNDGSDLHGETGAMLSGR